MPSTIRLHRVFRCPPRRLYRAMMDPRAMVKWTPPHGYVGEVHELDARVGGRYRMSFTNLSTGATHAFGGTYLELEPDERIRYSDQFEDPAMAGEMITTVSLRSVTGGTELTVEQAGVPDAIPPEMCYMGWQESLELLALLVEAQPA